MAATLPVDPANAAQNSAQSDDPSTTSSDYNSSAGFWKMVSDILAGTEAMRAASNAGAIGGPAIQLQNVPERSFAAMRFAELTSPYLPKFPNEPWDEYNRRRMNAFLTNIYGDISNNLASKPFSKECKLVDSSGDDLKKLSENIDGLGNSMHVFARDVFKVAMDKGITWILVDYNTVPNNATLADEREMGARSYWVHISPEKLLAVYSKFLNGVEVIFNARIDEPTLELDGYQEKLVRRVREFNRAPILDENNKIRGFGPATWKLYQENVEKDKATGKVNTTWEKIDGGDITIGIIPLVPIIMGKRQGTSWRVDPPLRDLAFMQVKLFQMENNLDCTKELTAFPMLAGEGISGEDQQGKKITVPVGPRAVLFAPVAGNGRAGTWHFIEPSGQSLTFLQTDIDKHKTAMRDAGLQPLDESNLTVITTANVSAKANNAVQAWALMAKDAFEQAWKFTAMWMKKNVEPEVYIYDDFGVDIDGASDMTELQGMEKEKIISKKLLFEEAKRRGKLSDNADYAKDQEQLAAEATNIALTPEKLIDPITGLPIVVHPEQGIPNPPPKPKIKIKPGERLVN